MPRKTQTQSETSQVEKSHKSRKQVVSETVTSVVEPVKRSRAVIPKESVDAEFLDLMQKVEAEISRVKYGQSSGVRFLRTINKHVKSLRTHASRLTKRKIQRRPGANTGGFSKPVNVSRELADFAGWNPSELHSRNDVTRLMCKYIKDHNLQNPQDGRQIQVENDPVLSGLLGYDVETASAPLTYYSLQTYLKRHYPTTGSAATTTVAESVPEPPRAERRHRRKAD